MNQLLLPRGATPAASAAPCTQHRHRPEPTYTELHHVIPQAWQAFWQPPEPWPNQGLSPDRYVATGGKLMLWDARTLNLCRTGHGNVHFWLVRAMRAYSSVLGDYGSNSSRFIDEAWALVRAGARKDGIKIAKADAAVALLAMTRWDAAGGSLLALSRAGMYGEI